MLQDVKILVMSHNIPTRLFTQWSATAVEVPVTIGYDSQVQSTEEVVTECLTLVLKMGVYLATLKVSGAPAEEVVIVAGTRRPTADATTTSHSSLAMRQ